MSGFRRISPWEALDSYTNPAMVAAGPPIRVEDLEAAFNPESRPTKEDSRSADVDWHRMQHRDLDRYYAEPYYSRHRSTVPFLRHSQIYGYPKVETDIPSEMKRKYFGFPLFQYVPDIDRKIEKKLEEKNNKNPRLENIAAQGRYGDTELAHVTPAEKDLLQALGGAGTVNPNTGLREYYDPSGAGVGADDVMGGSPMGGGHSLGGQALSGLSDTTSAPSVASSGGPNFSAKDAFTATSLAAGGTAALGPNPLGAMPAWGGAIYDTLTKGTAPDIQSMPQAQAMTTLTGMMGLAPIDLLSRGLQGLASALGVPNEGIQNPGAGTLGGSDMGITQPDSSAIASSATTAAASAPAAKSILPQSPIAGLDAQTYDYLRRMGIIA